MAGKLFLCSAGVDGGRMVLGFAVGTPVELGDARKVCDLPDGSSEHEQVIASGGDRFTLRLTAAPDGAIAKAIVSADDADAELPGGCP